MAFFVGRDREARRAYGFDEIALVPGAVTVNPDEVEISITIGGVKLEIPFLASAMDGVVDAKCSNIIWENLGDDYAGGSCYPDNGK